MFDDFIYTCVTEYTSMIFWKKRKVFKEIKNERFKYYENKRKRKEMKIERFK